MTVTLERAFITGSIDIITSKSVAHRVMICAGKADKPTKIYGLNASNDVLATRRCLTALGAEFADQADGSVTVYPIRAPGLAGGAPRAVLRTGESGSTLRFLLPYAAALGIDSDFVMEGRLQERPIDELTALMEKRGSRFSRRNNVLSVSGGLQAGEYALSGKISSQFASGLLMALPLAAGQSSLYFSENAESKGYVDITSDVLRLFSRPPEYRGGYYIIDGGRDYSSPGSVWIEGDWSNAAFFIVAALLNGDLEIRGLNRSSKQPDMKIVELAAEMGGKLEFSGDTLRVKKSELKGITVDASGIPDLIPVLSVAAGIAKGRTVILNAGRLRFKESDRLSAIAGMLNACGGKAEIDGDKMIIDGIGAYSGAA